MDSSASGTTIHSMLNDLNIFREITYLLDILRRKYQEFIKFFWLWRTSYDKISELYNQYVYKNKKVFTFICERNDTRPETNPRYR